MYDILVEYINLLYEVLVSKVNFIDVFMKKLFWLYLGINFFNNVLNKLFKLNIIFKIMCIIIYIL